MSTDSPQLVECSGRHEGRAHPLRPGENFVGRGGDVSVALDADDVSRRHARLDVDDDGAVVHDLGSKNGVFVAGRRIDVPTRLRDGDRLEIGGLMLALEHPASRVAKLLAQAGEPTVTRVGTPDEPTDRPSSLLWPLVGVAVFGGLVAALLLL